tara:strand:- start:102 stop:572 length:471 start_codon:yes stop_codon:yes gene_type:complete
MEKITHIVFDHDGTLVNTSIAPRQLYPGILKLLKKLNEREIPLYVWTARHRHSLVEILRSLAIMGCFKELSTPDDATPKPSIEGLLEMFPGVKPENIVVIGDSRSDMVGGKAFGAKCVGVIWGNDNPEAHKIMRDYGADFVVSEISELENWLLERI